MKLGELSKRSGLILGIERQANGYRHHGPEALWVLEVIAGAQSAGHRTRVSIDGGPATGRPPINGTSLPREAPAQDTPCETF